MLNAGDDVVCKVAIIDLEKETEDPLRQALGLIGGIDDLNVKDRCVVVKVGVFDHRSGPHSTPSIVGSITHCFDKAPKIFLVESDNYKGKASERLQIWETIFSDRVSPFSLSEDLDTKEFDIAGEKVSLSHVLFKPNVFVSTHVLRQYERGSVLKNLLGLVPDRKKVRFHEKLETMLLDLYQAVGGIDLAVLDGTYEYPCLAPSTAHERIETNVLLVGRDAVAVEAVVPSL